MDTGVTNALWSLLDLPLGVVQGVLGRGSQCVVVEVMTRIAMEAILQIIQTS